MTIPTFDGREVDAGRLAFSGSVDDSEQILEPDDEVTLIVKTRCTGVAFKTNQFGVLRRVHSLAVDFASVADETTAKRVALEAKAAADAEHGQGSLDGELNTDIDGTV